MTITEQALHRLHTHLEEAMGEEHAAALMECLPDGPIASKADVDGLREDMDARFVATKADIAGLREDMEARFAATRSDINGLREVMDARWEQTATKADFAHLREVMDIRWEQTATKAEFLELRGEMGCGFADLRTEMHQGFVRQTWGVVTAVSVINGLMLAALRLV